MQAQPACNVADVPSFARIPMRPVQYPCAGYTRRPCKHGSRPLGKEGEGELWGSVFSESSQCSWGGKLYERHKKRCQYRCTPVLQWRCHVGDGGRTAAARAGLTKTTETSRFFLPGALSSFRLASLSRRSLLEGLALAVPPPHPAESKMPSFGAIVAHLMFALSWIGCDQTSPAS